MSNNQVLEQWVECSQMADRMAANIARLQEPYRQNTIHWLERCADRRLKDLSADLADFLGELHPSMRGVYVDNLQMVLEDALHHFGQAAS
ncbi:MAG TPA: hypothetical protein VGA52_06590 [Anaerolineales bacterium]|jgi:hypothetical protein